MNSTVPVGPMALWVVVLDGHVMAAFPTPAGAWDWLLKYVGSPSAAHEFYAVKPITAVLMDAVQA